MYASLRDVALVKECMTVVCACDANSRSSLSDSYGLTEMGLVIAPSCAISAFPRSWLVNDVAVGDVAGEDVAMYDATSDTNNDSTPMAAENNHGAAADRVFEYTLSKYPSAEGALTAPISGRRVSDDPTGDVATNDADADDATSDTADGEPPQLLHGEDAGAMPYFPDASM